MDETPVEGARIFISYSRVDEALKLELDKHLKALKRSSKVSVWSDLQIVAGEEWRASLTDELARANVFLLLVSPDFNASDFIWDEELSVAMRRHDEGTARVVPIILRPCSWDSLPYARLQALPPRANPVTSYTDRDQAFTEIAEAIERLVDDMAAVTS